MTAKQINAKELERLLKADAAANHICREQTTMLGEKITKAETDFNLHRAAYGMVKRIWKMDAAKAAHCVRALLFYIDLLGLNAQTDLEDVEPQDDATIAEILANGGAAALQRFKEQVSDAETCVDVRRHAKKMTAEYPELEAKVTAIAEERERVLAAAEKQEGATQH